MIFNSQEKPKMITNEIQTPVNDALNQAIASAEVARKLAQDTHDWWTYNELGGLIEDLISLREKTIESNVIIFNKPTILS